MFYGVGFSFHHSGAVQKTANGGKGEEHEGTWKRREVENHHQINSFEIVPRCIQWSFIAFQQMVYFLFSPFCICQAPYDVLISQNFPQQQHIKVTSIFQ